jgi:hypothetical protein
VCQAIEGSSGGEDCSIVTPGKIVQEALTLNLDTGRQVLVQADEINELIGALLNQLANKAITGVAGLLGLSSGTGFTYSGYAGGSFLDALNQEADDIVASSTSDGLTMMTDALREERNYRSSSQFLADKLEVFIDDTSNATGSRDVAMIISDEITDEIERTNISISTLTQYVAEFDLASTTRRVEIFVDYSNLNRTSGIRKAQNIAEWQEQLSLLGIDPRDTRAIDEIIASQNATSTSTIEE